jgi:16S rRNA (adenine1518-N6/adenine1519-N6)-dimethyltransferase
LRTGRGLPPPDICASIWNPWRNMRVDPTPRKSLGQHFLHQRSVIDRIIHAFNPRQHETVVEIGPGTGALTFVLAPQVSVLHVIELDRRLVSLLRDQAAQYPQLVIHEADALRFDFCQLAAGTDNRIRVIGNLPYNISTPLIFWLLTHSHCTEDIWVMLQKEVAQRVRASPGTKDYGRLSVMVQQQCEARRLMTVAPGAFSPPPKVESEVLTLRPYRDPPYPVSNHSRFSNVVRAAFQKRRKTLKNALRELMSEAQIRAAGIDPGRRPEQLTVADYARLTDTSE